MDEMIGKREKRTHKEWILQNSHLHANGDGIRMRISGKIAVQLFLKLLRHSESSYAVDARRNADSTASVGGSLIYNTLLLAIVIFISILNCMKIMSVEV